MLKKDAQIFLDRVADDEPIFILRAQDMLAPYLVTVWIAELIRLVGPDGTRSREQRNQKIEEARTCVNFMRAWQSSNRYKLPD